MANYEQYGSVEESILTKEEYNVIKGLITAKDIDTDFNLRKYINDFSKDENNIKCFINFIKFRKIGPQLMEHKRMILDYIQNDINNLIAKKDDIIQNIVLLGNFNFKTEGGVAPLIIFDLLVVAAEIAFKTLIALFLTALMLETELLLLEQKELKEKILFKHLHCFYSCECEDIISEG